MPPYRITADFLVYGVFAGGLRPGQVVQCPKYPYPDGCFPLIVAVITRQSLVYRINYGFFAVLLQQLPSGIVYIRI